MQHSPDSHSSAVCANTCKLHLIFTNVHKEARPDNRGWLWLCDEADRRWVGATLTNMLPAGFTVLGVERLKAATAEGAAILHDVPLSAQDCLTFQAAEVFHVPVATLGFCALVGKNYL